MKKWIFLFLIVWFMGCTKSEFSEKSPYSVKVISQRIEKDAKSIAERLTREFKLNAFVVSRMEDNNDIYHDVLVDGLQKKEEAEELKKKLIDKGLKQSEVVEFSIVKKSMEDFKQAPKSDVSDFTLNLESVPKLNKIVIENLKNFPVNEDFKIVSLKIADSSFVKENQLIWKNFNFDYKFIPKGNTLTSMYENTDAISQAIYEDKIFGHEVGVIIISAKDKSERFDAILKKTDQKEFVLKNPNLMFKTDRGIVKGYLFEKSKGKDSIFSYIGSSEESNHIFIVQTDDMTENTFQEFMKKDSKQGGILFYPEVKSNLNILPKESEFTMDTNFAYYELSRIPKSYATERKNAWWAKNMVGHWRASGFFLKNSAPLSISFFNLNYSMTALKVHNNFMDEKKKSQSKSNHPTKVKDLNGWYMNSSGFSEMSFTKGSYVIAINSYRPTFSLETLDKISENLQIW